jgi:hypothetical protein
VPRFTIEIEARPSWQRTPAGARAGTW